ncbi:hypothetical protein DTO169C6_6770 [Paecilomyces variotii]|nr:hypothetical protein DTO169C6_6770 [Paecilomyces variotii]
MPHRPKACAAEARVFSTMRDDTIRAELENKYLGTLCMDVRKLETSWKDIERNRDINADHIKNLKNEFRTGVRRFDVDTQIKATLSAKDFDLALQAYIAELPELADISDVRSLLRQRQGGDSNFFIHLEKWPERLALPILQAGQHRRAALLELLTEQKEAAAAKAIDHKGKTIKKPQADAYLWAINLYNKAMSSEVLTALRSNCKDVARINTDREHMLSLIKEWEKKPIDRRKELLKNYKEFKNWARPIIGVSLNYAARAIAPLRNNIWLQRLREYLRTAYGRSHWNYTLGEMIINAKLDQIWITEFEKFFSFTKTIFTDEWSGVVSAEDWRLITEHYHGASNHALRMLFFPSRADYENNRLKPSLDRR